MQKETRTTQTLPEPYVQSETINLASDKKLVLLVNCTSIGIMALLYGAGMLLHPEDNLFFERGSAPFQIFRLCVLLALFVLYIFVHEWIHGICMKWFSGYPAFYGFNGMYAYAGSHSFFDKKEYKIIALAPVVVLGLILAALQCVVPDSWWWVIWWLQIMNLSGAAGDFYIFWRFSRLPASILVQDVGYEMTIYSPRSQREPASSPSSKPTI